MVTITDKSKCNGCHACYSACPKHCISMAEDEEGYRYPVIDNLVCVNCHMCENVCPVAHSKGREGINRAYAAYNTDDAVRRNSSSGGIFYLIARQIIEDGGVVFGAAFNEEFAVEHVMVETLEELPKLMTSKYLQSIIGNAYIEAKKYLDMGKKVLFTGTTCQIEGLQSYLSKEYNNLYLQDIICHGVPSPKLWREYLQYLGVRKVENINFRAKSPSWKGFSLVINNQRIATHEQDIYMQSFLCNLNLRPSCYDCAFKKENRNSDITLADFWGCEKSSVKEMDDGKGLSLVITHSLKGERILSSIEGELRQKEIELSEAIKFNRSYIKSVEKPASREKFFNKVNAKNYKKITLLYTRGSFMHRALLKIKRKIRGLVITGRYHSDSHAVD